MPTIQLIREKFLSEVFDYTTKKESKFKREKLAIIHFYADLEVLNNEFTDLVLAFFLITCLKANPQIEIYENRTI